jgi:hypothetical protein
MATPTLTSDDFNSGEYRIMVDVYSTETFVEVCKTVIDDSLLEMLGVTYYMELEKYTSSLRWNLLLNGGYLLPFTNFAKPIKIKGFLSEIKPLIYLRHYTNSNRRESQSQVKPLSDVGETTNGGLISVIYSNRYLQYLNETVYNYLKALCIERQFTVIEASAISAIANQIASLPTPFEISYTSSQELFSVGDVLTNIRANVTYTVVGIDPDVNVKKILVSGNIATCLPNDAIKYKPLDSTLIDVSRKEYVI